MAAKGFPLLTAFGIDTQIRVIALVGGGGKTSLMYALAHEMVRAGKRVVSTTTTRIFPPASAESPCLILSEADPELEELPSSISRFGHVTVGRNILGVGKLEGVSEATIARCCEAADWVLVEADGAARKPVKAPESWEPVIPGFTDLVIQVVGLDCLGKPATDEWVFRLERFLAVTGLAKGQLISPESIGRLLGHEEGGLQGAPKRAKLAAFLNKLDLMDDPGRIDAVAKAVAMSAGDRISRVVAGTVRGSISGTTYTVSRVGE